MNKIKILFALIVLQIVGLIFLSLASAYYLSKQKTGNEKLSATNDLRYVSYSLADQLRQSSDDLTRMVRTYVATGNSKWEDYFWRVLAIREGEVPRPENYDQVYWDLIVSDSSFHLLNEGEKIPLRKLMEKAQFSDSEFKLLDVSRQRSDNLVSMERIAMNAMKGKFLDAGGAFSISRDPDPDLARELLFGDDYHKAKKSIMEPINEFLISIDLRTKQIVEEAKYNNTIYLRNLTYIFEVFLLVVATLLYSIYIYKKRIIGQLHITIESKEKEIIERKRSESQLKKSEKWLRQSRQETESALTYLENVVESVSDGLIVIDTEKRVALINSTADKFFRGELKTALHQSIDEIVSSEMLLEQIKDAIKGIHDQFDFEVPIEQSKNNQIIRVRISNLIKNNGDHYGTVMIFHDITKDREIERMKSEFLSMAAHELRTPLTSIQGYSEIMLTRDDINSKDHKKYLQVINNQAVGLGSIVNELLDLSRIESGEGLELNKEIFNIDKVIKTVTGFVNNKYPECRIEIAVLDEHIELYADKGKIVQVIQNLLGNAIKFSSKTCIIKVAGKVVDKNYQLSIHDYGIGMTPEQVEKMFDRFFRADSSSTAKEGTGLGLSITKEIVEAHNGKIWTESEIGKGTKVSFSLPL